MKQEKIYVPRTTAKEIKFQNGGSMIKLGFHADSLIEFIKANTNEKGYINITVSARREVGQHGDTHSVALDTWKPDQSRGAPQQRPAQPTANPPRPKPQSDSTEPEDDVPF